MIDLGLTKLAILGVVALVVIGPEKLPKVARMAGSLYGRAQRYLHQVKTEVSREIELDELRNLQQQMQESARSIKDEVEQSIVHELHDVNEAWREAPATDMLALTTSDQERKAREFRRKKLVRSSAIPAWYKQRHGGKTHVISGAARVKKFRPGTSAKTSFFG